jgi:hypothetical protein
MSHQEEEDAAFLLFYPLLLISLKSAAVVLALIAHASPQNLLTCHLIYQGQMALLGRNRCHTPVPANAGAPV